MNRSLKRLLASAAAMTSILVSAATFATATPASAAGAYNTCNGSVRMFIGSMYYNVPAYNGSVKCNLVYNTGSYSNAVKVLQASLKYCEKMSWMDEPDGYYGVQTFSAVEAVQDKYNLGIDGTYGPQTRNAMRHYSKAYGCAKLSF